MCLLIIIFKKVFLVTKIFSLRYQIIVTRRHIFKIVVISCKVATVTKLQVASAALRLFNSLGVKFLLRINSFYYTNAVLMW